MARWTKEQKQKVLAYAETATIRETSEKFSVPEGTIKRWRSEQRRKAEPNPKSEPKANRTKKKTEPKSKKAGTKNNGKKTGVGNSELTEKQKLFCLYYIKNFNATQAYLKAFGCSYDVANAEGYKMLVKPCVKEEIARLKEIKRQSIMLDEDDIVERYMRIAFADMTDFVEFGKEEVPIITKDGLERDEDGEILKQTVNSLRLKKSSQVDGGLICEIKTSRQGTSIKLEDRQKALDWLARFFEMNPEHKHKKIHDEKKLQLERERLEHQKKMDETKAW